MIGTRWEWWMSGIWTALILFLIPSLTLFHCYTTLILSTKHLFTSKRIWHPVSPGFKQESPKNACSRRSHFCWRAECAFCYWKCISHTEKNAYIYMHFCQCRKLFYWGSDWPSNSQRIGSFLQQCSGTRKPNEPEIQTVVLTILKVLLKRFSSLLLWHNYQPQQMSCSPNVNIYLGSRWKWRLN